MHFHSFLVAAFIGVATASPTPGQHYVIHEKRSAPPAGWARAERVNPKAVLPLRIGLQQRNLDQADAFLDGVSNPASSRYAQHWTPKEVADAFAPRY